MHKHVLIVFTWILTRLCAPSMRQNAILKGCGYVHCQMVLKQYGDLNVYSANWRRNNSPQIDMSCQRDTLSYLQATQSLFLPLNASWGLSSNFLLDNSIQHYAIKFASDLRQIGCILRVTPVSPTNKNWPPRYNWNSVESGI